MPPRSPRFSTRVGTRRWHPSPPTPRAAASGASTRASCASSRCRPRHLQAGRSWRVAARAPPPTTTSSPTCSTSMPPIAVHSTVPPPPPPPPPPARILSEHLETPAEPLALLLSAEATAAPAAVAARAAGALLDLPEVPADAPPWLTPHQRPAAERLTAIIARHGGGVLADAVGLGKSYVALAVARMLGDPFTLVAPAVLVDQWRALLGRLGFEAPTITHEALSRPSPSAFVRLCPPPLFLVDEAHRFRNPETRRYRNLARLVVGPRLLLVSATPIHNRPADLFHLFRLFL